MIVYLGYHAAREQRPVSHAHKELPLSYLDGAAATVGPQECEKNMPWPGWPTPEWHTARGQWKGAESPHTYLAPKSTAVVQLRAGEPPVGPNPTYLRYLSYLLIM